jgi:hypothetical protein
MPVLTPTASSNPKSKIANQKFPKTSGWLPRPGFTQHPGAMWVRKRRRRSRPSGVCARRSSPVSGFENVVSNTRSSLAARRTHPQAEATAGGDARNNCFLSKREQPGSASHPEET